MDLFAVFLLSLRFTYRVLHADPMFCSFGVITVAAAIISIFLIVDFPEKAAFLTPEEKAYAIQRVQEDRGDAVPDQVTLGKVGAHMLDLKVWAFGMCFLCSTTASYAFAYVRSFLPCFLPLLLNADCLSYRAVPARHPEGRRLQH